MAKWDYTIPNCESTRMKRCLEFKYNMILLRWEDYRIYLDNTLI